MHGCGTCRSMAKNSGSDPFGGLRARIQHEQESLYPVLRIGCSRRELAHDAACRVPAIYRQESARDDRSDRTRAHARWFRASLPTRRRRRGRIARGRRGVSALLVLASVLFALPRPQKGSAQPLRAFTLCPKRSRPAFGRIRSEIKAAAREFSAGVFACLARKRGADFDGPMEPGQKAPLAIDYLLIARR